MSPSDNDINGTFTVVVVVVVDFIPLFCPYLHLSFCLFSLIISLKQEIAVDIDMSRYDLLFVLLRDVCYRGMCSCNYSTSCSARLQMHLFAAGGRSTKSVGDKSLWRGGGPHMKIYIMLVQVNTNRK